MHVLWAFVGILHSVGVYIGVLLLDIFVLCCVSGFSSASLDCRGNYCWS